MPSFEDTLAAIGNEPPLVADGRSKPPDRRELSTRWLSGTFLTGITSSVLMGAALFAALDGREQVAKPARVLSASSVAPGAQPNEKTDRLASTRVLTRLSAGRRLDVSTVTRTGDRDVVRTLPFVQVRMSLGASHAGNGTYPPFDPLTVLAEDVPTQSTVITGSIYGAKVDSAVTLRTVDFPVETAVFEEMNALTSEEVEVVVRNVGNVLVDGGVEVAALHYVDPERFGGALRASVSDQAFGIRIVEENVSIARAQKEPEEFTDYSEDIVPIRSESEIAGVLAEAGYVGAGTDGMAEAVAILLGSPMLKSGYVLRLGIETRESVRQIVRASIYNQRQHVLTVALDDARRYVRGSEPEANPAVFAAFETTHQPVAQASGDLPTVYDGIYRATSSHGLTQPMTRQLVQLLATKVDFESPADPTDQIEVFFSQPDENDKATGDSELLYIKTNFGGTARTFYRFQMEDGTIDYFDEAGRSVRQFLLRNPIPTGQFTSGFGNRRHPILGYARAHTGVDWAAPRGTPILASGDGIVEQAGWNGGYGQQTVIRHANGYQTTFNHQSKIADGVVPGARIRQGQIIGYVGSTGLSTGNHLHYELIINGTKVDPMRIRLPAERTLTGDELQAFLTERRRIDDLLLRSAGDLRTPAQNT